MKATRIFIGSWSNLHLISSICMELTCAICFWRGFSWGWRRSRWYERKGRAVACDSHSRTHRFLWDLLSIRGHIHGNTYIWILGLFWGSPCGPENQIYHLKMKIPIKKYILIHHLKFISIHGALCIISKIYSVCYKHNILYLELYWPVP